MLSKLTWAVGPLLSLSLSLAAVADILPPPGPTPSPTPRPMPPPTAVNAIYSCPPGPGWLKITFVNGFGQKVSKTNFVGNPTECANQTAALSATRPTLLPGQLLALCTTASTYIPSGPRKTHNLWFQRQYSLDVYGSLVYLPLVEYGSDYAKCLQDADALNRR